jgi:hypothetical protein
MVPYIISMTGVIPATGQNNTKFAWQASPWGTWEVGTAPEALDGINGTRYFITPETMDGRFGGNDTVQVRSQHIFIHLFIS